MRKIINKKLYDTDRATLIAEWDNGYPINDFHNCSEKLYVTKKGNYFIYGTGGPLSIYAKSFGRTTSGSEDIRSVSREDAIEWCLESQRPDIIEKHFPEGMEEA